MKLNTIRPPKSAFLSFFRQFLRDEFFMFVGSAIATGFVYAAIRWWYAGAIPNWIMLIVLPIAGPFLEKPWMLSAYVVKGVRRWRSDGTAQSPLFEHVRGVLREDEFVRTLRADILYHDTFYVLFMFILALLVPPATSFVAGCEAAFAFLFAVAGASYFEVIFVEQWRRIFLNRLAAAGDTKPQRYSEFRLAVPGELEPELLIERVRDEFELESSRVRNVEDFDVVGAKLPEFNEWEGYMQVRESSGKARLHIVFAQTQYAPHEALRTLYIQKEKVVLPLEEASISAVRRVLRPYAKKLLPNDDVQLKSIFQFTRTYAPGPIYSFVVDNVEIDENITSVLLEVKLWPEGLDSLHRAKQILQLSVPTVEVSHARAFTPDILRELPVPVHLIIPPDKEVELETGNTDVSGSSVK